MSEYLQSYAATINADTAMINAEKRLMDAWSEFQNAEIDYKIKS